MPPHPQAKNLRHAAPLHPRNICDFVACVVHGVVVRAVCDELTASLLHAAGVASRTFKLGATAANTAARAVLSEKIKFPTAKP
jgi:hypothetical protein